MKNTKKRLTFGFVDLLIALTFAEVLRLNVLLGIVMMVLVATRGLLGLLWGIPWRSEKIDWSKREEKPRTQVEERDRRN